MSRRRARARRCCACTRRAPTHGKSSPPAGWHNEEYQLTSAQYTAMVLEISAALELDRPILIGCSIGGRIALHLALEHPERFRAIIGLQAGAHVDPYYDLNFLHRPDVHAARSAARSFPALSDPTRRRRSAGRPCGTTCRAGPACSRAI